MDRLEEMFAKQSNLQKALGYDLQSMSTEERVAYIKEYALHLEHEIHEMLQELPFFKAWKHYPDNDTTKLNMIKAAQQEWADVTHFFLNVSLALGFDAEYLMWLFLDKNAINHTRQQDTAYKKCVGGNE